MITKIRKWGNSQGVRIPRQALNEAHLTIGDDVEVSTRGGVILMTPFRRIRGARSLKELVSQIPKNHRAEETEWRIPAGKEAS
ncbi:MAG: AbrB/MazE/SpoVT family DNA-binding domain-containing protein [Candidatus Hydrogenedentes bacterium]|nr:AbrB/MazE/SpoVT family DNA-binding domain-containing protein [Candidatus Hydrogenedentota bacterium]